MNDDKMKRGWIFDQILHVGQIEAALEHNDEQMCNLDHDLKESGGDLKEVEAITNEMVANREIMEIDYANRVELMNDMFDAIPGSNRHYWCQVKHRATSYVKACENYHARGFNAASERAMKRAGRALALTCSLAFGMEVMDCLRCLSDSLSIQANDKPVEKAEKKDEKDEKEKKPKEL